MRGTLLEEAKNGEARVLLRFFESNRGNGYSVPPRISFGYSRQRPAVADQTSPQKPFIAFSGIRDKPLMPEKVMRDSREKFKKISFSEEFLSTRRQYNTISVWDHIFLPFASVVHNNKEAADRRFVEYFKKKPLTKGTKECIILEHADVGRIAPFWQSDIFTKGEKLCQPLTS